MPDASQDTEGRTRDSAGKEARRRFARGAVVRRDLRLSIWEGLASCLMLGFGETYLAAYALALGFGATEAVLLSGVPPVAGAALQLISSWGVRRLGSLQRWIILCIALQGAAFLPLCVGAAIGALPLWGLFLVVSLYWAGGFGAGAAWNTWMGTLVPARVRPRYFAKRSRWCQASIAMGLVAGGLTLDLARSADEGVLWWAHSQEVGIPVDPESSPGSDSVGMQAAEIGAREHDSSAPQKTRQAGRWELSAFALLMGLSGVARFAGLRLLSKQSEPVPVPHDDREVSWVEVVQRLRKGQDGRLFAYLVAMQFSLFIASGAFTPYMLDELHYPYLTYLLVLVTVFVFKVIMLPVAGKVAARIGARKVLWIGGVGVVPMAALWMVSGNPWYLMMLQVFSGVAWACYELSAYLLILETVPERERTSIQAKYNFANAAAMVGGANVGAFILHAGSQSRDAYLVVFGISSLCRLVTLLLLRRVTGEVTSPTPITLLFESVRPGVGSVVRPIIASIPPVVTQAIPTPLRNAARRSFGDDAK